MLILFRNETGAQVLNAELETVYRCAEDVGIACSEGMMCVGRGRGRDRRYAYFTEDGAQVTDFVWEEATEFRDGLAAVARNGKWGYIDRTGAYALKPQWNYAEAFADGLALVTDGEIEAAWSDFDFRPELVSGTWSLIDREGNVRLSGLEDVDAFEDGVAAALMNGKWGFIGVRGRWIVPAAWDEAACLGEGVPAVRGGADGAWTYYDASGEVIGGLAGGFSDPAQNWGEWTRFSEGLRSVRESASGLYGYIDRTGAWVIEPGFDYAGDFSRGLAVARQPGGLCGYIDYTGAFVLRPAWKYAENFDADGYARVAGENGVSWQINRAGETVSMPDDLWWTTGK